MEKKIRRMGWRLSKEGSVIFGRGWVYVFAGLEDSRGQVGWRRGVFKRERGFVYIVGGTFLLLSPWEEE